MRPDVRAALVSLSMGALWATILAADHPDRVDGPGVHLPGGTAGARRTTGVIFSPVRRAARHQRGLGEIQPLLLARDYRGFLEFFFGKCFNEPHSTKQIEDCVNWGLETDAGDAGRVTRGIDPSTAETHG